MIATIPIPLVLVSVAFDRKGMYIYPKTLHTNGGRVCGNIRKVTFGRTW